MGTGPVLEWAEGVSGIEMAHPCHQWADRQVPTLPALSPPETQGCPSGQWLRRHLQLTEPQSPKPQEHCGLGGIQIPALVGPLTAGPLGLQSEEGTASLQVIQDGVARAEGGHDVGRFGAGEGH